MADCTRTVGEVTQGSAKIEVCMRVIGFQDDGAAILHDGLLELPFLLEKCAELVVHLRATGLVC